MAKVRNILVTLAALVAFGAIFANVASAECGPAFSNKKQAVNYYKNHPGAADMLKSWLLAHPGAYEYHADQGLLTYLEQPNVKAFVTPAGYSLTENTQCANGPEGGYSPYNGLYDNMSGKVMLWYCHKSGKCYPILKGYCRNGVFGPPVIKKPPKKHPPRRLPVIIKKVTKDSYGKRIATPTGTFRFWVKTSKWKHGKKVVLKHNPQRIGYFPTGTKVTVKEIKPIGPDDWKVVSAKKQDPRVGKRKLKIVFVNKEKGNPVKPSCEAQGLITVAGNCVNQSNSAEQNCKDQGGTWDSVKQQCTIIQINANCSNVTVVNGSGNVVSTTQEGNCNTIVTPPPPPEEPCGCIPKPSIKITSTTDLNMIATGKTSGDFYIGTYASESGGVLTVDPGIGAISSCNSSTPKGSFVSNVPSGASETCVILYAPEDKDKPASMTVTMTVNLGSVSDQKTQTVPITYPTRP